VWQPPVTSGGDRIGEPIRGVEVIILGADGPGAKRQRLERGEIGELAVRSASVMSGYFGEPELSRSLFHDGFFRTGDLGYLDTAGKSLSHKPYGAGWNEHRRSERWIRWR